MDYTELGMAVFLSPCTATSSYRLAYRWWDGQELHVFIELYVQLHAGTFVL